MARNETKLFCKQKTEGMSRMIIVECRRDKIVSLLYVYRFTAAKMVRFLEMLEKNG